MRLTLTHGQDLDWADVEADAQRRIDELEMHFARQHDDTDTVNRLVTQQTNGINRLTRVTNSEPMRDKQSRYVYVLLRQLGELDRSAADKGREWFERNAATLTKVQASDWINRLKDKIESSRNNNHAPVAAPAGNRNAWTEWTTVAAELFAAGGHPSGVRFAVPTEDGATNTLAFWWLSTFEWNGHKRYKLRQVIGGQGPVRVRLSPEAMTAIVRKALIDPRAAMARYGQELGSCGRCGRVLTNDESRAMGIGPECAKK